MYRKIESELIKWKKNSKMPLMLVGARQTGKTYILETFCKSNFENYIYINLEKEKDISAIFDATLEPDNIIEKIEILKMPKQTNIKYDVQHQPKSFLLLLPFAPCPINQKSKNIVYYYRSNHQEHIFWLSPSIKN